MSSSEIPPQDILISSAPATLPLPMPPLGSTASGGPLTTLPPKPERPLAEVLNSLGKAMAKRRETVETPPRALPVQPKASKPPAVPSEKLVTVKDDPAAQDQLTDLLCQVYASQQTYGDKAQMMDWRDKMFQLVLGNYTIAQVTTAFMEHVRRSSALPTPHDIAVLIEPSLAPLSSAMFVRLTAKAKQGQWLTSDEREYMRRFEAQELRKVKETA